MKIVWFSNIDIISNPKGSGTWMYSMANMLSKNYDIEIVNITQSSTKQITKTQKGNFTQYYIPFYSLHRGIPLQKNISKIVSIIDSENPDLFHIWGTEKYWGLLFTRGYIKGKYIIEIQGLIHKIEPVFYGALNHFEKLMSHYPKEILFPFKSILYEKFRMRQWAKYEIEIIRNAKIISTQSKWVRECVKSINKEATILNAKIHLREEFLNAPKWDFNNCDPNNFKLFALSSYFLPFKGFHNLFKAFSIVKQKYPTAKLYIAGFIQNDNPSFFTPGYIKWLFKLSEKLKISDNIIYLGSIDAEEIVKNLQTTHVFINPSFIESYSLTTVESLFLGVPSVVSQSGALPELGKDNQTILFFQPNNYIECAQKIFQIIENKEYSEFLSSNAIEYLYNINRNDVQMENQWDIYNGLIS